MEPASILTKTLKQSSFQAKLSSRWRVERLSSSTKGRQASSFQRVDSHLPCSLRDSKVSGPATPSRSSQKASTQRCRSSCMAIMRSARWARRSWTTSACSGSAERRWWSQRPRVESLKALNGAEPAEVVSAASIHSAASAIPAFPRASRSSGGVVNSMRRIGSVRSLSNVVCLKSSLVAATSLPRYAKESSLLLTAASK